MLHLEIRNTIKFFIYLARIEHDAVSKISYCHFTEPIIIPKKNHRKQNTNTMPRQKRIDGERRIYNYQKWLERFKHYTKRKYDTDVGPLVKEEIMNGIEWEVKKRKETARLS